MYEVQRPEIVNNPNFIHFKQKVMRKSSNISEHPNAELGLKRTYQQLFWNDSFFTVTKDLQNNFHGNKQNETSKINCSDSHTRQGSDVSRWRE